MKKIILGMLLVVSSTMSVFATDIRQVMFGNNYETIKEIDADSFLDEHPDIRNYVSRIELGDFMMREHDKEYFRCFAQTIGNKRFVRVVKAVNPLSDEYILGWRNPDKISSHENHAYITQMFCLPEKRTAIAILPFCKMDADGYAWENGTDNKYEMIEIIQRNGNVKGFLFTRLVDKIDHHDRIEEYHRIEETYINTAEYYLFDDVINNATESFGKVKYARNYSKLQHVSIEASQPLVDSKRPFMYTINNAFDGNASTAYAENTEDDLFKIYIGWENSKFTENAANALKITNGYAKNKELYYANNRIKCIGYYSWDDDDYKEIDIDDRKDPSIITLARFSGTFSIVDKYKGDRYNDTCVSEIDFHFISTDWLIGD